jgi:hypothetical protein
MTTPPLSKVLRYAEAMEAIEAMCSEGTGSPEFRVYQSPNLDGWWRGTLAERGDMQDIYADGPTLYEAVLNLKKVIDDGN